MSTSTQVQRRLTDDEMATIVAATESGGWVSAVIETYRCFGVDMTDQAGPSISPSDYAIPEDQWGIIATACGVGHGNEIGRVNHMLDWMNYAPSGYAS